MSKHRSVNDFLPKAEAKKTEIKEETNASGGTDNPLGNTGENLPPESGGGNTGGAGEGEPASAGVGGEQTNTNNNVGGLGDAQVNAASQSATNGAGGATSKPSTKKGAKPASK